MTQMRSSTLIIRGYRIIRDINNFSSADTDSILVGISSKPKEDVLSVTDLFELMKGCEKERVPVHAVPCKLVLPGVDRDKDAYEIESSIFYNGICRAIFDNNRGKFPFTIYPYDRADAVPYRKADGGLCTVDIEDKVVNLLDLNCLITVHSEFSPFEGCKYSYYEIGDTDKVSSCYGIRHENFMKKPSILNLTAYMAMLAKVSSAYLPIKTAIVRCFPIFSDFDFSILKYPETVLFYRHRSEAEFDEPRIRYAVIRFVFFDRKSLLSKYALTISKSCIYEYEKSFLCPEIYYPNG